MSVKKFRPTSFHKHDHKKDAHHAYSHPWIFVLFLGITGVAFIGFVRYQSVNAAPDSLREFKIKYPEASAFVDNYSHRKHYDQIDVSPDIKPGYIPLFIQWDKRWGYELYGNDFLAVTGCGPTCMSMVVCGLKQTAAWNPLQMARYAEKMGYYINGEGTSWNLMTEGARHFGLQVEDGLLTKDYLRQRLSESTPMICSMKPGDFTYTGHFIVLRGIDQNGKIILNDPNSLQKSRKHWDINVLLPQIKHIWSYSTI